MIHQVSKLPQACILLTDIIALQITVLEVAARNDSVVVGDVDEFRVRLAEHFETKRRFCKRQDQPDHIAEWIVGKKKTLVGPLVEFARAAPSEKEEFVSRVKCDVSLLYCPRSATLSVAVLESAREWEKGAKDFLYAFYDLWSNPGFAPCLFSRSIAGRYTRYRFVDEFAARNPDLYLCAICDSTAYRTRTDARAYTSVEHFFPRSVYPHLSCHPYNLIPICSYCNSYIKNTRNPMQSSGEALTVLDLILPYQGSKGLSELAYITIRPRDPVDRDYHPLTIKMMPRQGSDLGKRLSAFNSLYRVEERWDNALEQIEEQAFRRMCQFLALDLALGAALPDSEQVRQKLNLLMAFTLRDNLGKDPFAFAITWVLKHYVDQLETHRERAAVYVALKEWAGSHGERWRELRDLAEAIHSRVPQQQ